MNKLVIYKRCKNPTQSGVFFKEGWCGKIENHNKFVRCEEKSMCWNQSLNTLNQVELNFDCLEDATNFANKNGYLLVVEEKSGSSDFKPKSYSAIFK